MMFSTEHLIRLCFSLRGGIREVMGDMLWKKEVIQLTPQRSFGLILCTIIVTGGAVHDACDATCKAMQTKRFGNMITNLSKETSGD